MRHQERERHHARATSRNAARKWGESSSKRSSALGVRRHFQQVAPVYRSVRLTDHEPVERIVEAVGRSTVIALDVGCGTGRYTQLLARRLAPGSRVFGADFVPEMLHSGGLRGRAVTAAAEALPFRNESMDLVTTFNAVHHFSLEQFLADVERLLAPGGRVFIYTRTAEQNRQGVFGRFFPGFVEKETRLSDEETLVSALEGRLGKVRLDRFRFPRRARLSELRDRVLAKHYSTFSLYDPDEFRAALDEFEERIRRTLGGEDPVVTWEDGNVLVSGEKAS